MKWIGRNRSLAARENLSAEQVVVCSLCGHINPESTNRCNNCWVHLADTAVVHEAEGQRLARRIRLRWLRNRLVRFGLTLALATGLTASGVLIFFDLGPLPSDPTSDVSANPGPRAWAQAGRTAENTGFTPDSGPVSFGDVNWTYATTQAIVSSPTVVENRVYLTTEDGRALALDRGTGQLVWEYQTGSVSDSHPAVAGDLVFLGLRDGRIIALDSETGAEVWEHVLGNPVFASPIVVDGTVYVGSTDSKLYAFDAANGRERWTFTVRDWIVSRVAYADDKLAVISRDGLLHILDTKTGRKRFVYDAGWPMNRGPTIHEDRVYLVSSPGTVWAVDLNAITYPFERAWWTFRFNLWAWGVTSNVPPQKGTIWGANVGGKVQLSLAFGHGMLYVANTDGQVVALNATTGEKQWATDLEIDITADPVVAGRIVLVGTHEGTLYGLDAFTGQKMSVFKAEGKISASPVVLGDMMYVASRDGKLYAISIGR